jgi:hypothetical protein
MPRKNKLTPSRKGAKKKRASFVYALFAFFAAGLEQWRFFAHQAITTAIVGVPYVKCVTRLSFLCVLGVLA